MQEQVHKSDREEKLLEYTNKQKCYDSFFNEWNCCEEWDTDNDTNDNDHAGKTLHINIQPPTEKANADAQPYPVDPCPGVDMGSLQNPGQMQKYSHSMVKLMILHYHLSTWISAKTLTGNGCNPKC
ncbi:hypothetical protein P691DRAFT_765943 [Macrolepiota fuliginosa MF-IS2]|uniref:Uncharacterized protein n=1 Tax=Macrolepiota fuliginosa MF-IS2 TaxID=1400762 RepID=A0A9P6BVF3_9AGAR|nr:hypothetical protein P691DRAFT_765943 [Macrolepiota fuliginosa MF-IS2]